MQNSERPKQGPNPIDAPDTNNATFIAWVEVPPNEKWPADFYPETKRRYYQYLDRMNSGLQNGPEYQNKRYETYRINRWYILSLSSHLKMSDKLRTLAVSLFDGLNRSEFGIGIHVPAIATCGYIIHQHDPHRKCHPQISTEKFDSLVKQEMVNLQVTHEQYASLYGKIEHRVRTGQLTPSKRDNYGVDPQGLQPWRQFNEGGDDGWL